MKTATRDGNTDKGWKQLTSKILLIHRFQTDGDCCPVSIQLYEMLIFLYFGSLMALKPVKNLVLLVLLLTVAFNMKAQLQDRSINQHLVEADNNRLVSNATANQIALPRKPAGRLIAAMPPIASSPIGSFAENQDRSAQMVSCNDSSFLKLFESPNRSYSFMCSAKTSDDGILIGGFGNDKTGPPYTPWNAVVTKLDNQGNHIWSKTLQSYVVSGVFITRIKELSDGSIIITGGYPNKLYYTAPVEYNDFFVSKLTSTGDLVWIKTFHTPLSPYGCTSTNFFFNAIEEGANGDLLFSGTLWNCPLPKYLSVFKLNSSGMLQWKYAFLPNGIEDGFGAAIFYEGSNVTVVNKSSNTGSGTDDVIHVDLVKLDYNSGNMISYKGWKVDRPYPASFYSSFVNNMNAVKLTNGNYCIYGAAFGVYNFDPAVATPHYSVLEFNSNYDFVNGYTIQTPVTVSPDVARIKVDKNKRVIYSDYSYLVYPDVDLYIGSIYNNQVQNQRKREYRNQEVFYNNFELLNDGSYIFINTLATVGQSSFSLEYSLLHNSDTGSICLGLHNEFSTIVPVQYVPYNFTWKPINNDPFYETNNQNTVINPLPYSPLSPCIQKAVCDTIKIHGIPVSCDYQQPFVFTAFKNRSCGSRVNWNMDTAAVQDFETVNDTTVRIKLRKQWQGWLYGSINTSCGVVTDSVFIAATNTTGQVNIGPDRQLCPGNTIVLHAGKGYQSYLWNDGSADSLLTVSAPGTYYIEATNACGNIYRDTVIITPSPLISFNIGADRTKCNNDTVQLKAPAGFLNYTWGPAYNINTINAQSVVVNPSVDTLYYVRAEKTAGCFAYDSIRITVKNSLPINAGPDTSFCAGDSAVLNAGAGFSQYLWNNGSTAQQITVYSTGLFSITALANNGCTSYDTVRILNVWTNPVPSMRSDTGICKGDTRLLNPGSFNTYLWQDGSTQSYFNATGTGVYFVTVMDKHLCKASDTVIISTLWPLPAKFLGPDTAICTYGTLKLATADKFAGYLWSTGSASPALIISAAGSYSLQVRDNHQCVGKDTVLVVAKDCLTGFYVPSAFSPNNDGHNDSFKPILGGKVKQYQFTIYNRWGQLVFTSNDLNRGWDGKYKGKLQDSDLFIWVCSYQFERGVVQKSKGSFMLIK